MMEYGDFIRRKVIQAPRLGFDVQDDEIHPVLKLHQRMSVKWMVEGGRRACFASFGLGKSLMQLEAVRLTLKKAGGRGLIVAPLGVRAEFIRDAKLVDQRVEFVRRIEECDPTGIYITNYETIRDGKLDPREFTVSSLDESSVLRGFGGTKTFREFMRLFTADDRAGGAMSRARSGQLGVPYRFVATATPSPNEYIELLAYSAYLEVLDVSAAKTRFFKRDSTRADKLTIHPHKEREFWLWVASWAIWMQKPSDLGCDDTGYDLPPIEVVWHELPTSHANAGFERDGQVKMFRDAAMGVSDASREKRDTMNARTAKAAEIVAAEPDEHFIVWHDLEDERKAIVDAIPEAVDVFGSQNLDVREKRIADFSDGKFRVLATKPVLAGSGCNFQRHCSRAVFMGIGFKFNDFIQAIHRVQRFLQTKPVRIDLIYTEAERSIRKQLERKWQQHEKAVSRMAEIIKEFGLSHAAMAQHLTRAVGVERVEIQGDGYTIVNNDSVLECARMEENSVGLILTSVPFSTQYEYSPNYADFGHSEDNEQFFEQMDYLTPNLLRVLMPGRLAAIHVKDRIIPGGLTGLGFQTVYPFHARCIEHYTKHGFAYMGMKTIVTDVVRENKQTYRLGWSEQCKDGSKMGVGMPEYLLIFRKPPTDTTNSYADVPVVKSKQRYTRSRWQIDAHGFSRSSGNRLLKPEELASLPHEKIFKMFREFGLTNVYDFEHHVKLGESMELSGRLPVTFMLLQPPSWSKDVWSDVTRMLTLNGAQSAKGREMHLCLARGSMVLTKERGYVPIQDVVVGEHVVTHKGRWRKVLIVRNTGVQPVVTVKAHGVPGLTLTPDHKLWIRKTWDEAPEWVEAQDAFGCLVNLKSGEGEGLWVMVDEIEDSGEAETWCLKVEEDESFTAEGCVVKNCPMQFDLADRAIEQWTNPGETVLDPFGGLMTVPYRAILQRRKGIGIELSPSYFLDGAAYCEMGAREMATPTLFDLDALDRDSVPVEDAGAVEVDA